MKRDPTMQDLAVLEHGLHGPFWRLVVAELQEEAESCLQALKTASGERVVALQKQIAGLEQAIEVPETRLREWEKALKG